MVYLLATLIVYTLNGHAEPQKQNNENSFFSYSLSEAEQFQDRTLIYLDVKGVLDKKYITSTGIYHNKEIVSPEHVRKQKGVISSKNIPGSDKHASSTSNITDPDLRPSERCNEFEARQISGRRSDTSADGTELYFVSNNPIEGRFFYNKLDLQSGHIQTIDSLTYEQSKHPDSKYLSVNFSTKETYFSKPLHPVSSKDISTGLAYKNGCLFQKTDGSKLEFKLTTKPYSPETKNFLYEHILSYNRMIPKYAYEFIYNSNPEVEAINGQAVAATSDGRYALCVPAGDMRKAGEGVLFSTETGKIVSNVWTDTQINSHNTMIPRTVKECKPGAGIDKKFAILKDKMTAMPKYIVSVNSRFGDSHDPRTYADLRIEDLNTKKIVVISLIDLALLDYLKNDAFHPSYVSRREPSILPVLEDTELLVFFNPAFVLNIDKIMNDYYAGMIQSIKRKHCSAKTMGAIQQANKIVTKDENGNQITKYVDVTDFGCVNYDYFLSNHLRNLYGYSWKNEFKP